MKKAPAQLERSDCVGGLPNLPQAFNLECSPAAAPATRDDVFVPVVPISR